MPKWTKEQEEAINQSGQNIIVSAGAGSGKTAVLSERVITKLKKGISSDNLLILTFTNAAAAEMKERIRKKIIEANLKDELAKVDTADITTFDAYALGLVKKYSHYLNISSDLSIVDSSIMSLEKKHIIKNIFDEYYQNKNPKFLKLISDFTLKDDKKIIKNILKLNESLDNLYNKDEYLKTYIKNYFNETQINNYIQDYLNLLNTKQKSIKNTIHSLSYYTDGTYIEKLETTLTNLINAKTYEEIKLSIPDRIPNLPRGSEEETKSIKQELSTLIKEIKELTKYKDIDFIKETINQTKDYTEIIIDIILKLDKKLTEFKQEKNVYEFIDIARIAINLLKENKEIRETLKEKYHEILIDEYQDTNDIQETFISYIEKNNVYMVGDIKQSIYRFRHTNPELFKTKYENYSANKGGLKIDLNKNFRSRDEVLNNINEMFNQIMDSDIGGADYITSHQMIFGNTAYNEIHKENYHMEILNYETPEDKTYSKDEIEIFTIAKDIQTKIQNKYQIMDKDTNKAKELEYKDCAILIDRSSKFELYKKIFEYLNIPITIYRDKAINNSDEIIIFKHIYNLILSNKIDTNFKYSFTSLARSYLFQMSDNEILTHLNNNDYKETDIWEKCQILKQNLDEQTNETLIRKIIDTFNLYEKMITIGDINSRITIIDSLIKVAINCDKLGYEIKDFYEYLNEVLEDGLDIKLALNKEDSNSVKIMTIHASKGLEFPICYFSSLSKKFNIDDLKNLFYFSDKYGFIIPYFDNSPKSTILKTLLKNNYMKEEISERIRLFYVALTRAREKMILVTSMEEEITVKENGVVDDSIRLKYLSFQNILNSIYKSLEKYKKDIDLSTINLTKDYNLSKKATSKQDFSTAKPININELNIKKEELSKSHFSKTTHNLYSKEEKTNIELGLKLHSILENINFQNPNLENLTPFEQRKVTSFINSGILKGTKQTYKEYEFIYEKSKEEYHGIIDLLLIKENENIIVDYKLKHTTDEAYLKQLNGYKKYIETITNQPTKIYLYSILDEKLINLNEKALIN